MPSLSRSDGVNYLNIGLMLFSAAVALYIPFELFLFAYAVLGPAHYLTEISWLHKRQFFTKGRHDYWVLGGLAVVLLLASPIFSASFNQFEHYRTIAELTVLALGAALVFLLTARLAYRVIGLAIVAAVTLVSVNVDVYLTMLLAIFIPTLVHVYVFTGFFMIYGALKERSKTGYLAFAVFLLCPVFYLWLDPARFASARYVVESYWKHFSLINQALLGIPQPQTTAQLSDAVEKVFTSRGGLIAMRFLAFAYTYHYLNWFSKTSIIRWHEVPKQRLVLIGALWLASVGVYAYDYSLGIKVLFCLSFMHLFLEFPLNHLSIMGTFRELRGLLAGAA